MQSDPVKNQVMSPLSSDGSHLPRVKANDTFLIVSRAQEGPSTPPTPAPLQPTSAGPASSLSHSIPGAVTALPFRMCFAPKCSRLTQPRVSFPYCLHPFTWTCPPRQGLPWTWDPGPVTSAAFLSHLIFSPRHFAPSNAPHVLFIYILFIVRLVLNC